MEEVFYTCLVFSLDALTSNYVLTQGTSLLFLAVTLFAVLSFAIRGVLKNRRNNPNFLVLIFAVFIGISIVFLGAHTHLGGYFFAVAPSAVIVANFSETTKYRWLSELILGLLVFAIVLQFGFNISSLLK